MIIQKLIKAGQSKERILSELTLDEWDWTNHIGVMRNTFAEQEKYKNKYGQGPIESERQHKEGANAEYAFAKYKDIYWDGNLGGNLHAGDVGGYEVRAATHELSSLILHPDDKPHRPYILVTGYAPYLFIRGWIWARQGMLPRFWCDPQGTRRPAFFFPQAWLHPMVELPILPQSSKRNTIDSMQDFLAKGQE
jgi:hypothetical protein